MRRTWRNLIPCRDVNHKNGIITTSALSRLLGLGAIITVSPSFTSSRYPMPIPTLPKLGLGPPLVIHPIGVICSSFLKTGDPVLGNGRLVGQISRKDIVIAAINMKSQTWRVK